MHLLHSMQLGYMSSDNLIYSSSRPQIILLPMDVLYIEFEHGEVDFRGGMLATPALAWLQSSWKRLSVSGTLISRLLLSQWYYTTKKQHSASLSLVSTLVTPLLCSWANSKNQRFRLKREACEFNSSIFFGCGFNLILWNGICTS